MALIFHDGFETGGGDAWDTLVGSPTFVVTHPKTGNYEMRCNASGSSIYAYQGDTTRRITVYLYIASAPSSDCLILGTLSTNGRTAIKLNTSRYLELWEGYTTPTKYDTGSTLLSTGTWYRISLCVDAGIAAKIYIDGIEECSAINSVFLNETQEIGVIGNVTADLYFDDYAAKVRMSPMSSVDDIQSEA